jgi:quercetin dioxygenase-like cupin family protein
MRAFLVRAFWLVRPVVSYGIDMTIIVPYVRRGTIVPQAGMGDPAERKAAMNSHGAVVRQAGEGEMRWFFGGGLHTWKATAEETDGAFLLFEDHMAEGKMTPYHTHPQADEAFYVLDGEIIVHVEGAEHRIGPGGFATALRGVPHAFMATSEARMLCIQTPGSGQAFFRHASEPAAEHSIQGPVDFGRVEASAKAHGGVELLGPPPFAATR